MGETDIMTNMKVNFLTCTIETAPPSPDTSATVEEGWNSVAVMIGPSALESTFRSLKCFVSSIPLLRLCGRWRERNGPECF